MNRNELEMRVLEIVLESAEGGLTATELEEASGSLRAVGYSSLAYIRMLDRLDNELGAYIDPEETGTLSTLDEIVAMVSEVLDVS